MLLTMLLFFDFSGGEFLLIAVVFLMFFGSKSIPGMARALGKAVRDFKEAANSVQREIHESATVEEVKKTSPSTLTTPPITAPPSSIPQQTTIIAPPDRGNKTVSGRAQTLSISHFQFTILLYLAYLCKSLCVMGPTGFDSRPK